MSPTSPLISQAYAAEQQALHAKGNYGTASIGFAGMVSELIDENNVRTLLDYGCGRMRNLAKHIAPGHDVEYIAYDPGVPELSAPAEPAEEEFVPEARERRGAEPTAASVFGTKD